MGEPLFLLQIVEAKSGVIAGGGSLQVDLRQALRASLQQQGVGFLKTETQVLAALDVALGEAFSRLKKATRSLA